MTTIRDRATLGINIASTLCWAWGVLLFFSSIAVAIPMLVLRRSLVGPIVILLIAAVLCYAGYGLRKRRRAAAWTAVVTCGLFALLQLGNLTAVAVLGLVCNVAVVTLVLLNWRQFGLPAPAGEGIRTA